MVGIGQRPTTPGPRRGEIYFVTFREVDGHVLFGPHPAVVVQADAMATSSTVVVVPLTSSARSTALAPPYLVPVSARETGLDRDGWIKADQLFTFSSAGLGRRAGQLAASKLEDLDRALRFVLGL